MTLDLQAIAAWNAGGDRARAEYAADQAVAAGICQQPNCANKTNDRHRRNCWAHNGKRRLRIHLKES